VKEPVVADSTCLIGLERIGRLDLLPALFDPILMPPEVAREFGSPLPWLQTEPLTSNLLVAVLRLLVDAGEAEAIALASEKGYRLISDDKQARAVAKRLGVTMIGTVGILVRAKQEGVIPEIKPILDDLEANSFFISAALRAEALRLTGNDFRQIGKSIHWCEAC
jgi:predicted nucleic acid-binding protein